MARSINDKQAWNCDLNVKNSFTFGDLLDEFTLREEGCTNLLCNTSSLSFLHISPSDFVQ